MLKFLIVKSNEINEDIFNTLLTSSFSQIQLEEEEEGITLM